MAIDFVSASTYFTETTNPITDVPATIACWHNPNVVTGTKIYASVFESSTRVFDIRQSAATIQLVHWGSVSLRTVTSTGTISAGTWHHACGRSSGASNRELFLNGSSEGSSSSNAGTLSAVEYDIGHQNGGSSRQTGKLAEIGIWNVALDDDEIAALADGYAPVLIRPQSLNHYWPCLFLSGGALPDRMTGLNATANGSPAVADHPPIIYPTHGKNFFVPAAVGGGDGTDMPWPQTQNPVLLRPEVIGY